MVSLLWHELKLLSCKRQDSILPIGFFVLTIMMFPLGLTPNVKFISQAAPGIVMVSFLFAQLLSLERLFSHDQRSGLLDAYRTHPSGISGFILIKIIAHWLGLLIPLLLLSPLIAVLLGINAHTTLAMVLAFLVGSPFLSLVGAVGAALTLGVRNSALMLIMIVLPLFVAPLIFMASAMNAAMNAVTDAGMSALGIDQYSAELALLGAMSIIAALVCPLLIGWIIRSLD